MYRILAFKQINISTSINLLFVKKSSWDPKWVKNTVCILKKMQKFPLEVIEATSINLHVT